MLKPKTSNESDKVVSKLAKAVHDILTIFIVFPSLPSVVCSSCRLYEYGREFNCGNQNNDFHTEYIRISEVIPQNAFKLSFNKPCDITVHLSSTRSWYIMKLLHVKKTLK